MRTTLVALLALFCHASAQEAGLAGLTQMLSSDADSVVLYRFRDASWDGAYWTSEDEVDAPRDRPHPMLPHRGLAVDALQPLTFVAEDSLFLADGETLSHSYVLEILKQGRPQFRIDVHSDGEGVPCLFLIDHTESIFAEGYAVLGLNQHGAQTWLAVLDALWESRSLRLDAEPDQGSLVLLDLPRPYRDLVLDQCAQSDDERFQLVADLVGSWGMASLYEPRGGRSDALDVIVAGGFDRDSEGGLAQVRVHELGRVAGPGQLEFRLRTDLSWQGSQTRRVFFYLAWTVSKAEGNPACWQQRWYGPYFPSE